MKKLNYTIKALLLLLFISLSSCKKDAYPELEDGLYAEFVTNKGTLVAKLFFEKTPVTVANFVALAEGVHPLVSDKYKSKPYYNGLSFHRVINDFMAQGGDPTGTGTGNPGYKFDDEFSPDLKHYKKGILAMANSGYGTNGSQFYITHKPTGWLDAFDGDGNLKLCTDPGVSCHTVFGELVVNVDAITAIQKGDTLIKLNIIRKGFEAGKFDAVKTWNTELEPLEQRNKENEEKAAKLAKEKIDKAKAAFLKENETLKGNVKQLPTGLAMIFTKQSKAAKPKSTQSVLVNYAGYFEDGRLFDTSMQEVAKKYNQYNEKKAESYKPFTIQYNETAALVPGFREAILNMVPGDKARVFIPSFLGYGPQGSRGVIPPNTNLVFDIEIMGIAN